MNIDVTQIENIFNSTYKKSEICKLLGIEYSKHKNAIVIDNEILEYSKLIGLCTRENISSDNLHKRYWNNQIKLYNENPKFCVNCGKIIPFEKRLNKCCSTSCGASYGNRQKNPKSEATKEKIRISCIKTKNNGVYVPKNQFLIQKDIKYTPIYISELIKQGKILNENNYQYKDKPLNENTLKEKTCIICGRKYYGLINKSGKLSAAAVCSDDCHLKLKILRGKESAKKIMKEGRFIGWQSRNIKSYAEKFWHNVLKNNNIEYIHEYHLDKKYFLDFYIEKNGVYIDLEIDGKQHKYKDRIEHDKIRDEYIKSKNIVVYRIDWNEIKTKNGSNLMKEKIDKFLDFYNNL